MQTREFRWFKWIKDACRWLVIGSVFIFIDRTANQTGVFDDVVIRVIALVGQTGYFVLSGANLLKTDPYYYTYHLNEEEQSEE